MQRVLHVFLCGFALLVAAVPAGAQALPGYDNTVSWNRAKIGENHWKLVGGVELESNGTSIFADEAEVFLDENRAIATGNVLFTQGANRIAADRADFNTVTRLGTFYNARGIANVQPPRQRPRAGGVAPPPVVGQDNDVYFFGETVEKIGPKKYRIINGGFSTCVQPTPRWSLTAGTVVLNIDHYTLLHEPTLMVKGVPLLYLPFPVYYPTKKEDRATGFLIPTYGMSTLLGQQLHNAFFWAINRSQDATIEHAYSSKVGQGINGQYRYNYGGLNFGDLTAHLQDQHEATYDLGNGKSNTVAGSRSFDLRGGMNQSLPGNFRAQANVNYFSSILTNLTYNTNPGVAGTNYRTFGGNVTGAIGGYSVNSTFNRTEYFYNTTDSGVSGYTPRVSITRNERPLFGSALYFSASGEFVDILRESKTAGTNIDTGLARLDFTPTIRFPFKKWQWFTVNSSLSWRDTYYTKSYDPATVASGQTPVETDQSVSRRFFTVQTQITGPVFNRVWDTPDNGYAEKFKHTIEPTLSISRTSSIDNYSEIVKLEGIDGIVGGATQLTYGVGNRLYAKRKAGPGLPAISREIVGVDLSQSYYSDQRSSVVDQQYATSFTGAAPSHFSPIALSVRAMPSTDVNTMLRAEFDARYHSLRTISANGSYSWTNRLQTTVGWSKRFYIPDLTGFNDKKYLDHYINVSSNLHTVDNKFGGLYSFNYDVLNKALVQQQITGFYNAQCCGIAFQYQIYNYSAASSVPVAADHRFFLSFTLAGLGNFSPFNGALSGVPR
jgi:LPS-assembly protein